MGFKLTPEANDELVSVDLTLGTFYIKPVNATDSPLVTRVVDWTRQTGVTSKSDERMLAQLIVMVVVDDKGDGPDDPDEFVRRMKSSDILAILGAVSDPVVEVADGIEKKRQSQKGQS